MFAVMYWIQLIFFRFLVNLFRWTSAIYYWKRCEKVPSIRNPLLHKSAKSLAADIRNGKLKSKDIVHAYIDRIQEVEPYLNAVVEDRFDEALKEAKQVDEIIQAGTFSIHQLEKDKPLLGVPVTVKVMLKVKGFHCTGGSRLFKDLIADEDAPSVAIVKNAGGIVIATTNIPEYGIAMETNNPVHGRTCNPYDTSRTPGGSSGGEGALLAAGASAVGIGTDVAGSVRIPAHFTGIYGHKPTRGLVPNKGTFPAIHPKSEKYGSIGPMCRYVEDLVMMMKILTAPNENHVKFNKEIDFKKLKIFYLTSIRDPRMLPVDKEIEEGIHKAISHFTISYGVKAQELKLPLIAKTNDIIHHLAQMPIEKLTEYLTLGKVSEINTFKELLNLLIGQSNFNFAIICTLTAFKYSLIANKKNIPYYLDVQEKLTEEFENLLDDDSVIISPTCAQTASYHNELPLVLGLSYTSVYNITGMPATAVPMGFNRKGLPQGLQIIAKKNNDSLTLACAEELYKVFGGWTPPGR